MKPWEKYGAQPEAQAPAQPGPWSKYAPTATKAGAADPTGSGVENFAAGIGAKITDLGLGIKQRLAESLTGSSTGAGFDALGQMIGMKPAAQRAAEVQQEVAEKRRLDAPLMATTGGKLGAIAGTAVPAVLASMAPGGQSLAGSMIAGGTLGAAQPTLEDESASTNALLGAGGGAAGFGLGKLVNAGVQKTLTARAAAQAANQVKDAAAANSQAAGYVIPPVQTNPSLINRALEGFSGKLSTAQAASVKNQATTNALARQSLGLAEDTPLTLETLKGVRENASGIYRELKTLGQMTGDAKFNNQIAGLKGAYEGAAKDFPGLAKPELSQILDSLKQPSFKASSAVDAIRLLREEADQAFASGSKGTAKALRQASQAMEDLVERNLQRIKAQEKLDVLLKRGATSGEIVEEAMTNPASAMLDKFRQARQLIAKTYSVEKALNPATGNVAAQKLGAQLARQKPLSGELKSIGEFGLGFKTASQEINSSIPGLSPLDFMGAATLSGLTANPLMMATAATRPLARSLILSSPYQSAMGGASYSPGMAGLLGSPASQEVLRIGALISPQLLQQK